MTLECDGCGRLHPACSCHREKPMKQNTAKKIAAKYLAGEATLEELDDAVYASLEYDRNAEIERLRKEVNLYWERWADNTSRIVDLEHLNNLPWWKKLLGMK